MSTEYEEILRTKRKIRESAKRALEELVEFDYNVKKFGYPVKYGFNESLKLILDILEGYSK
jgi:hypothetical protein